MEVNGPVHSKKQLGEREQAIYNWHHMHFSIHNTPFVFPFTMCICMRCGNYKAGALHVQGRKLFQQSLSQFLQLASHLFCATYNTSSSTDHLCASVLSLQQHSRSVLTCIYISWNNHQCVCIILCVKTTLQPTHKRAGFPYCATGCAPAHPQCLAFIQYYSMVRCVQKCYKIRTGAATLTGTPISSTLRTHSTSPSHALSKSFISYSRERINMCVYAKQLTTL